MNENGHSALIKAAIRGHIWIVDALCQAGANIDHIDNQGMNALHFACLNGRNLQTLSLNKALIFMPQSLYNSAQFS